MARYHVRYYYLATGMEGRADERDCGYLDAVSPGDAKDIVAKKEYPVDIMYGPDNSYSTRGFFRGCLIASLAE